MNDPISNLIIKLKNASLVGRESVTVTRSKLILAILKILEREGFVTLPETDKKSVRLIEVGLVYDGPGEPRLHGIKRVSKYSRRFYVKSRDIRPVRNGFGKMILTTPMGIITGEEAKKAHTGGEVLFTIW